MRKFDDTAIKELLIIVQCGSDEEKNEAQKKIYEDNEGLVWSVVKRYANRNVECEDLFQIGSIGLIKAIRNFDLNYDVCFSTYAVPMIAGEIRRFLRDEGPIKVSRQIKELSIKIRHFIEEYRKATFREPTVSEISREMSVPSEDIIVALEATRNPESIYAVVDDNATSPEYIVDRILKSNENEKIEYEHLLDKIIIDKAMDDLDEKEKMIIKLRYFKEKTQTEIANELGVSQVQVSRLEKRILMKMRKSIQQE